MEKEIITELSSLLYYKKRRKEKITDILDEQVFENLIIDFELDIEDLDKTSLRFDNKRNQNPILKFKNCDFLQDVTFKLLHNYELEFSKQCIFKGSVKSSKLFNNITFRDTTLQKIDFEDAIFGYGENKNDKKGKVRFHNCIIHEANFRNTTFNNLADFWNTTFIKPVIFYKTDFLETTVFSAVIFKENVLFTYALLNSVTIFRGTNFEKGLDLSLAILKGELNLFDLKVKYFKHSEPNGEDDYEQDVSENGNIPLKNKQETYRIIKKHYNNQSNTIKALDFKYLERSTQSKALINEIFRNKKEEYEHLLELIYSKLKAFANQVIHILNVYSNAYGKSYVLGLIFTFTIGSIFFSLSMLGTSKYTFDLILGDWFIIDDNISHFLNFLNPTHKFNYLGDDFSKYTLSPSFYIWDFVGRIFVGYGIYQTIQAFRKYR
ncbi:Pentapeptide repeat-containing protein [Tenacibaculum maritimum]|uniref:pentapeptide repeat-containing protein n=4 Tax=Tenacibaculum maritimum TaxID=107401 RepID=UPI0012E6559F|nr:pentapeptide repeat-containing protein [Tenacibaculum maritimum]CAA0155238.1 Pentapeptide repeat-containing protein [Tenacibaculum maritimum]